MTTAPLPPVVHPNVPWHTLEGYVFSHFWQAYEGHSRQVHFSYGGRYPDAPVQIVSDGEAFFTGTAPYPPDPAFLVWNEQELPFFFTDAATGPLLTLSPGRAEIHADIVAAAFYLLSGWQEYFSEERDQHGRFPYSASVQQRYGFVTVPVVNHYFDLLRTAVEHVTGQPLRPRRWTADAPFASFVTHDIDNLYSAWKELAKEALRNFDAYGFLHQLGRHLAQPDAWDNLAQVRQAVTEHGAVSTFFLLPENRKAANGTPNADYRIRRVWPRLAAAIGDAEVGLHASYGTSRHGAQLKSEEHRLQYLQNGQKVYGIRFHYLQWEPRITPTLLDSLLYEYDTTLGFAEHFGFRHSYCLPFHPFDFEHNRSCRFLEIPLNLMDATLHHPRYLQLAPDEILPAIEPMLGEIERFGGVFTLLWHNENFDPANEQNGPQEFHRIMRYLRSRNTAFLTGRQIVEGMMV